jgi:flagellar FliL protein
MASNVVSEKTTVAAAKLSMTVWFGIMIVLTLIAAGGGAGFGLYLTSQAKTMLGAEVKEVKEAAAEPPPGPPRIENPNVRELAPIITNIGQTSDTWIRLHAAIIFDPATVDKPDILAAEITADVLGFLQTLSIAQLSGPTGLQHLREDLNDRAIVRSDGRVRELVIESVVVQ